jgi:hypothetical protein
VFGIREMVLQPALDLSQGMWVTGDRMGSNASATATSGSSSARPSSVAETGPSTEFSTGTQAASVSPLRTAVIAARMVSHGINSAVACSCRAACSVNVPCGPK